MEKGVLLLNRGRNSLIASCSGSRNPQCSPCWERSSPLAGSSSGMRRCGTSQSGRGSDLAGLGSSRPPALLSFDSRTSSPVLRVGRQSQYGTGLGSVEYKQNPQNPLALSSPPRRCPSPFPSSTTSENVLFHIQLWICPAEKFMLTLACF